MTKTCDNSGVETGLWKRISQISLGFFRSVGGRRWRADLMFARASVARNETGSSTASPKGPTVRTSYQREWKSTEISTLLPKGSGTTVAKALRGRIRSVPTSRDDAALQAPASMAIILPNGWFSLRDRSHRLQIVVPAGRDSPEGGI